MQDESKRKTGWDERITEANKAAWLKWLCDLPCLNDVRIPRCYCSRNPNHVQEFQLHHFCDASERAYGTVSYLRIIKAGEQHEVAFVCDRAKVAPLKRQTIPRLELCTATMAAKVDAQLRKDLDL